MGLFFLFTDTTLEGIVGHRREADWRERGRKKELNSYWLRRRHHFHNRAGMRVLTLTSRSRSIFTFPTTTAAAASPRRFSALCRKPSPELTFVSCIIHRDSGSAHPGGRAFSSLSRVASFLKSSSGFAESRCGISSYAARTMDLDDAAVGLGVGGGVMEEEEGSIEASQARIPVRAYFFSTR